MADIDGLWAARFATPAGAGAGVVTLKDGRALGGDSMMAYVGDYTLNGDQIEVKLQVTTHTASPGMVSIFGADDLPLSLQGSVNGGAIVNLTGTTPVAPGVTLKVAMQKLA